jgi:hypothetical protein
VDDQPILSEIDYRIQLTRVVNIMVFLVMKVMQRHSFRKWVIGVMGLLLIPILSFGSEQTITILFSSNDLGYMEPCG